MPGYCLFGRMHTSAKPKIRLLIGILSCRRHARRAKAIRATWLKKPLPSDARAFFLVSQRHAGQAHPDEWLLDCEDTYEETPLKMALFFKAALEKFDFDYLYKCDDDTYVNTAKLLAYDCGGRDYIGHVCKGTISRVHHIDKVSSARFRRPYEGEITQRWCMGGPGYFLSRRAVEIAAQALSTEKARAWLAAEPWEDKCVGDVLAQAGIRPSDDRSFAQWVPQWMDAHKISYHYIAPWLMPFWHSIFFRQCFLSVCRFGRHIQQFFKNLRLAPAQKYAAIHE